MTRLSEADVRHLGRTLGAPLCARHSTGHGRHLAAALDEDPAWADEVAAEWVEYVENAGIDVVGNLDDLRPVHPGDGDWQDADLAKPRRVADAAVDALVAVLLEAAAHEDEAPHETRLSRAARKLRGQ